MIEPGENKESPRRTDPKRRPESLQVAFQRPHPSQQANHSVSITSKEPAPQNRSHPAQTCQNTDKLRKSLSPQIGSFFVNSAPISTALWYTRRAFSRLRRTSPATLRLSLVFSIREAESLHPKIWASDTCSLSRACLSAAVTLGEHDGFGSISTPASDWVSRPNPPGYLRISPLRATLASPGGVLPSDSFDSLARTRVAPRQTLR